MLQGKRIFMTGGAGFVGTTLCSRLADDNEIILYDNLLRNTAVQTSVLQHRNVRLVEGDVLDRDALSAAMRGATHVVHLAAVAGVDSVLRSPVTTMNVNVQGTFNTLAAAHECGSIERFVDFSTSEVFGAYAYKVDETHISPTVSVGEARWTYAISKLASEFMSHSHYHEFGLPTVILRPFNVYGPGQTGEGAIHHFVRRAIANEDIVIHGDGSQIRAWCYVDDMVEGTMLALEHEGAVGQAFNIGNPRSTVTVYDLAHTVQRLARSDSAISYKPLGYVDIEVRIPDIKKARTALGYEPEVDLEEGLLRTIDWYRSRMSGG